MENSPPASTPISERVAVTVAAIERYVLPWIYGWYAWSGFAAYRGGIYWRYLDFLNENRLHLGHPPGPPFWASITRQGLIACLSAFIGLTLLLSRRTTHLPRTLAQITVPLAMSFYFLLYNDTKWMPYALRRSLLPPAWHVPAAVVAVVLSIAGYSIAIWGLLYMRRNFGMVVAVRGLVSGGPYAYVRHPIYCGYLLDFAGLVVAWASPGMLLLSVGFLMLMVVRARLEEDRLSEVYPEYRDYMNRTGFLFPKFGRKASAPPLEDEAAS